jgi:putative transposase
LPDIIKDFRLLSSDGRPEYTFTCNPRRDLTLRYADGAAPVPVATTAQQAKSNSNGELRTG